MVVGEWKVLVWMSLYGEPRRKEECAPSRARGTPHPVKERRDRQEKTLKNEPISGREEGRGSQRLPKGWHCVKRKGYRVRCSGSPTWRKTGNVALIHNRQQSWGSLGGKESLTQYFLYPFSSGFTEMGGIHLVDNTLPFCSLFGSREENLQKCFALTEMTMQMPKPENHSTFG